MSTQKTIGTLRKLVISILHVYCHTSSLHKKKQSACLSFFLQSRSYLVCHIECSIPFDVRLTDKVAWKERTLLVTYTTLVCCSSSLSGSLSESAVSSQFETVAEAAGFLVSHCYFIVITFLRCVCARHLCSG